MLKYPQATDWYKVKEDESFPVNQWNNSLSLSSFRISYPQSRFHQEHLHANIDQRFYDLHVSNYYVKILQKHVKLWGHVTK